MFKNVKIKNIFSLATPTKLTSPQQEILEVFTDGSCINNGKKNNVKAGIGAFFGHGSDMNISKPFDIPPLTNNRAELYAITSALKMIRKKEREIHKSDIFYKKIIIKTDSDYSIKCVTKWIKNWKKNGWRNAKKNPVLNKDLIVELDHLLSKKRYKNRVQFEHVRGHMGIEGNEQSDRLAKNGAFS